MGTNYYRRSGVDANDAPLHIGKSSGGWAFALHVYPEQGINDLEDWRRWWQKPTDVIEDGNGTVVAAEQLEKIITVRSWPGRELRRAEVDGQHCIGRGEGTWDYFIGEFS